MGFIDDWGGISPPDVVFLSDQCLNSQCGHARDMHGRVNRSRPRGGMFLSLTPSRCETCKCDAFRDTGSVTEDDVFAATRMLKLIGTLADFGIDPLPPEEEKSPDDPPEAW